MDWQHVADQLGDELGEDVYISVKENEVLLQGADDHWQKDSKRFADVMVAVMDAVEKYDEIVTRVEKVWDAPVDRRQICVLEGWRAEEIEEKEEMIGDYLEERLGDSR